MRGASRRHAVTDHETAWAPGNAGFRLASAADARATAAKQRFVGAFDPLAMRFGGRTWSAGEF